MAPRRPAASASWARSSPAVAGAGAASTTLSASSLRSPHHTVHPGLGPARVEALRGRTEPDLDAAGAQSGREGTDERGHAVAQRPEQRGAVGIGTRHLGPQRAA